MKQRMLKAPDGREFLYQYSRVDHPAAAILCIHGIHDHSQTFAALIEEFVQEGWYAGALDYRGHGPRARTLGDLESLSLVLGEIDNARQEIQKTVGDCPLFLLGHSFGGNLMFHYAADHSEGLTGLISLAATAKVPGYVNPLTKAAASLIAALAPKWPIEPFAWREASSDPQVIQDMESDPFYYKNKVRARMGREMLKAWASLPGKLARITLPLLALHGDADVNVPPEDLDFIASHIPSSDLQQEHLPRLRHILFKEPEGGEEVRKKVKEWIHQRTEYPLNDKKPD